MPKKQIKNVNCVTFGLYTNKTQNKMFTKIFDMVTQYKNNYIRYVWKQLNNYGELDNEFKKALEIVQTQKKLYGTTVNKQELNKKVKQAYNYVLQVFKEDKLNLSKFASEFKKLNGGLILLLVLL